MCYDAIPRLKFGLASKKKRTEVWLHIFCLTVYSQANGSSNFKDFLLFVMHFINLSTIDASE